MTISALDKDTVKLITTTQIITSVSNAVKELIENALDANAKNIEINLTDNGATLIEVKDDGCGISKADAPYMALASHTSKIFNLSDLDSLETYGFRGEALYALSAVSDLTVVSKTDQDEAAVSYVIDHCGRIVKSEPCHRATGTTVQVRQLFKQIPVRRQIITTPKKANQDIKILESLIKSYGMCKFFVRISYKVDSNIIFAKPGTATLEEAVTYVLGKKVTSNMTWIDVESAEINMKLMVPRKEIQNVSEVFQSGAQYVFVNNRPIKHKDLEKMLTKTILEAFGQDSFSRKKPIFLLYILTDAANIDVNLEPNKTSILFKEQQIVFDTMDKRIKDFYGIQREVQEESIINNEEIERPACKKRKLLTEESVDKCIEEDVRVPQNSEISVAKSLSPTSNNNNSERNNQAQIAKSGQNNQNENDDECKKNSENFNIQLPFIDLSESDSNESQKFTLSYSDNDNSLNLTNENKKQDTDDSPPFELTPQSETLSQLPIVDLGEDFQWDNCSVTYDIDTSEKENKKQNENAQALQLKNKSNTKKCVTLEEWSKGHVSGLKGGTDVQPYIDTESNELLESDSCHTNVCKGFVKFSKDIRPRVAEQNPTMTAPQIAYVITNLWKKLSAEERGFYRDLASEEQIECKKKKQEMEIKTSKNRMLKVLKKMNTMNLQNKESLLMRTIVPWDIDLKKVTGSFLNNSLCKNTNFVVGLLCANLWIIHKSAHIWILDAVRLKKELNISDTSTTEESAERIEQLLQQWFSVKDDLSLLHPIHSFTQNQRS